MSDENKRVNRVVLAELIKRNTFKHILFSIGFNVVSKGHNHALLNNDNGVQLVVARFGSLDSPVQVYFWQLDKVLSKAGALLFILDNHRFDWLLDDRALVHPNYGNVDGIQTGEEFIFSAALSVKEARELCMLLKSVKEVPNAYGVDLSVLAGDPYSFRAYNRTVQLGGIVKDYLSFLLYRGKNTVGVQSVEFDLGGKAREVPINGLFNGYFTNDKPKTASKAVLFFSFETFLNTGGYKSFTDQKVFVFPPSSKSDLFLEVLTYCTMEGLEPSLYFPIGQNLAGADNFVRFNLFYLCFRNKHIGAMDYSGDLLSRRVTFSFDKQKYVLLHFAECHRELRVKSIKYYEDMLLVMDDFDRLLPFADNNLGEHVYWCQLDFYLKEPLLEFAMEYLYKALEVDPPQKITEG